MEEEKSEVRVSKYNSAVAQLYRIDNLWQMCHAASQKGDYYLWNNALDKVWAELAGDLTDKDTRVQDFLKLNKKLEGIPTPKVNGFYAENATNQAFSSKIYPILIEKEIFLRRLQNTLGKGTKWDSSDEDDLD